MPGTRPTRRTSASDYAFAAENRRYFRRLGYAIEDDREIETDYYNFDALNIPEGHPARESQDTFYTTHGFALRSQTSTVQIRAMERRGAPIQNHRARTSFPPRHARYDAYADVSSDRRIVRGQRHHDGASQRHGRRMAEKICSAKKRKIRLRPVIFPVHRTERGIRFFVFQMQRHAEFLRTKDAARAKVRAGSNSAVREWFIRMSYAPAMLTRKFIRVLPSASVWKECVR